MIDSTLLGLALFFGIIAFGCPIMFHSCSMLGQLPKVTETTPNLQKIDYWQMGFFWTIIVVADFGLMMVLAVIALELLAVDVLFGVTPIILFVLVIQAILAGIGHGAMHRDMEPTKTS